MTVIDTLDEKVLFAIDHFDKNINGNVFYDWCKYTLTPSLKSKCVIVMDNASFHKPVPKLLNRYGHRLLFLTPYSHDFNLLRKNGHRLSFYDKVGWITILPKLFHNIECTNSILV